MIPENIAHYRITSKLGAGGMGEVYRATDSRLGREVAIKVLPEAVADQPERLARFEREAKMLAALNHPNIAAIYGIEGRALVMEFVDGPSLAKLIAAGPIAVKTALSIARQIAEAVEYAHEKGIVHRDLKPANVHVVTAGAGSTVKVLDFGLAKALGEPPTPADPTDSPTITIGAETVVGVILGTAAYMSPEQARGRVVDRRADIWAFGAVLYEMLTGRRAFAGETISDTLAAVLKSEPDFSRLPPDLPPRIRDLLERCLRKEPHERLRDIGEARIWIGEAQSEPKAIPSAAVAKPRRRWMWAIPCLAAGALLGGLVWRGRTPQPANPWTGTLLGGPSFSLGPRISPDDKTLAFQTMTRGQLQVAVMKPESGNWTLLTHETSLGSVQEIAWSPDATKLYFSRFLGHPRGIYSVPVLGGEEHLVLEDASNPEMLPDGTILVLRINSQRQFQIHRYWPDTGRLQPLPAEVTLGDISLPVRAFPDGKEAVYFGRPIPAAQNDPPAALYALDLATGRSRRIAPRVPLSSPQRGFGFPLAVSPDGHSVLLEIEKGNLYSIISVPRNGDTPPETLLTSTQQTWYMDAAADGGLYLDQLYAPAEALRFSPAGGRPERLARGGFLSVSPIFEQADESVLLSAIFAGKTRLAIARPGGDLAPVTETTEEISTYVTRLGDRAVAFVLGSGKGVIAVASLPDGRVIRRIPIPGGSIDALASSADGKTIFYVASRTVWSVAAEGGTPVRIGEGDSIATGAGSEVIAKLNEKDGYRLARLSQNGGQAVGVPLEPGTILADSPLAPEALSVDGRIIAQVNEPGTWFYRMATVDLKTGHLTPVPVEYVGDIWFPQWARNGQILAVGIEYNFGLWRFRR